MSAVANERDVWDLLDLLDDDESLHNEVEIITQALLEAQASNPVLTDAESWLDAIKEGGQRYGFAWLTYQQDVLTVFDAMGLERADYRNLAVKIALMHAEKMEALKALLSPAPDGLEEEATCSTCRRRDPRERK